MNQRLIILRGCTSSGKSTLAKSYRSFENKIVWLKVDAFKNFFADDATPALIHVNNLAVVALKYLLEQEFSVVIEGVFQDTSNIDKALEIAKQLNVPAYVFELEASLETLKKRDLAREGVPQGWRSPLGDETIERIFNILKANPYHKAIKLDTEKNSLEKCQEIIDKSFKENRVTPEFKKQVKKFMDEHNDTLRELAKR